MLPLTPPTPAPPHTQKVTEDVQFVARAAVVKEQTYEERVLFLLEPFTNEVWGLLAAAIAVRPPAWGARFGLISPVREVVRPYTFCAQNTMRCLCSSLV